MSVLALSSRRLSVVTLMARVRARAGDWWIAVTVVVLCALAGAVAFVGGDARWPAALGRVIASIGLPRGVPFASAPSAHWHNALALAELALYGLERAFGDAGLIAAQTLAITIGMSLLARDMRARGAAAGAVCLTLVLVLCGAATSFAIVRVQLFSLALFPATLALLRADARRRSARIWLALPLLALWSNLHGAVLVGVLVLYVHLLFERSRGGRRLESAAIAVLAPVALCMTSAGPQTIGYFLGLTRNLAAQRGAGMWAPLGTGVFDLTLIVVAAAMLAGAILATRRPRAWEWVTALVLIVATVRASRDGVWLVMFLAAPSAAGFSDLLRRLAGARRRPSTDTTRPRDWWGLIPLAAALGVLLLVIDVTHWAGDASTRPPAPVARAVALAHGSPILADTVPGEQVALAGGRIWAGNPLDAFSRSVQARYLDFDQGLASGSAALGLPQIHVVLVTAGSAAASLVARSPSYRSLGSTDGLSLYVRR